MSRLEYEDWKDRWMALVDKWDVEGYESLSPDERIWFIIRGLIDSVGNGGLVSFYYNPNADHLDDTMDALRALGALEVIEIMNRVNSLFPGGRPSGDIDERNAVIDQWDDSVSDLLEQLDQEFWELDDDLEDELDPVIRRLLG